MYSVKKNAHVPLLKCYVKYYPQSMFLKNVFSPYVNQIIFHACYIEKYFEYLRNKKTPHFDL